MKTLREAMKERGDTQTTLSAVLGITQVSLSNKMCGHQQFKQAEIRAIAERYGLSAEEIRAMFEL